jgi:hypothetical protein
MTGAFHGHIPNISQAMGEELGHIWDRLNSLVHAAAAGDDGDESPTIAQVAYFHVAHISI